MKHQIYICGVSRSVSVDDLMDNEMSNILKNSDLSLRDLTLCTMGHSAFQYLFAGCELGLFQLLYDRPNLEKSAISSELDIAEHPARCLLFGLTGLGFLHKSGQKYSNSVFFHRLITNGKLDVLIKLTRFQAFIVYPGQFDFLLSLRRNENVGLEKISGEGNDLYHKLACNSDLQSVFFEFMGAWSKESMPLLLRSVTFDRSARITDVGGGDGTAAILLAQAYPHLKITVLDIPEICDRARNRIISEGLESRIETVPRNILAEALPAGCDCFLFMHFLQICSPEQIQWLLTSAYESLPNGGRVIIFSSMASDQEDGPLFAALDSAYFMAIPTAAGFVYSYKDYEGWITLAGFTTVNRVVCDSWWTPHGIVIGTK